MAVLDPAGSGPAPARGARPVNSNQRGNTRDRARRKALLLSPAGGWGGDGETVPCWECGVLCGPVDVDLCVDRIIPAARGGTYWDPDNIAPHCSQCSHRQGNRLMRIQIAPDVELYVGPVLITEAVGVDNTDKCGVVSFV